MRSSGRKLGGAFAFSSHGCNGTSETCWFEKFRVAALPVNAKDARSKVRRFIGPCQPCRGRDHAQGSTSAGAAQRSSTMMLIGRGLTDCHASDRHRYRELEGVQVHTTSLPVSSSLRLRVWVGPELSEFRLPASNSESESGISNLDTPVA